MNTSTSNYFKPSDVPGNLTCRDNFNVRGYIDPGFVLALATVGSVRLLTSQVVVTAHDDVRWLNLKHIPLPKNCIIESVHSCSITFGFNAPELANAEQ